MDHLPIENTKTNSDGCDTNESRYSGNDDSDLIDDVAFRSFDSGFSDGSFRLFLMVRL